MNSVSPLKRQSHHRQAPLRLITKPNMIRAIADKQATVTSVVARKTTTEPSAASLHHSASKQSEGSATGESVSDESGSGELGQSLKALSNNELVLLCQNTEDKNRAAFEELVSRYQRYIDKMLYHLASDWSDRADLAQEVWIRVYRSIHRLKEPSKFKGWLSRITTNLFYDELRKRKRFKGAVSLDAPRYSSDGQYDWELPSKGPTPTDTMMTQEFHDQLKVAMAELPEVFQKTIAMRELQGLSYEEIANITGVSLGTVKSRIARSRHRLQEKLSMYLVPVKVSK